MGCSGSKTVQDASLQTTAGSERKKKYGKAGTPRVPPGMGPSFPTHTDMGCPLPPDHSHDHCNASHKTPPSSNSPYGEKMVEQHEKMMQGQQAGSDLEGRPDFVVPIPLPQHFHPRILTEISLPRHVPRPYPQLGNYDPMAAAKRSKSRNMILLFGGPGCGKETYSAKLAAEFGLTNISLGELLRAEARKNNSEGVECEKSITDGQLVPFSVVMGLLEAAIFAAPSRNFLIQGFPRTVDQATAIQELGKPKLAIFLECSAKELEKRLLKRAKASGRTDDTPEIIAKRLESFRLETLPVLDFYAQDTSTPLKKVSIDGLLKSEDKIYNELSQDVNNVFFPMSVQTTFVLLLGGPGCGKGTQCGLLVEDFGFHHLSTGDLLREEVKKGSDIGKKCEKLMKDGKLVPLSIISQLLQRAIVSAQRKSFLIDGIKTVDQAKEFDSKVGKPTTVILLTCSPEVMEERLLKRAETSGRSDDNPKTIKKRIDGFNTDSKVLIEYYKKTVPDAFFEVAAERSQGDIYQEVRTLVEKKTKKTTKADKIANVNKEKALGVVKKRQGARDSQTILFVLGEPGCGKGTQCERIVADFGFKHLSAGDLLRAEVKKGSELGRKCEALMKEGKLVPAEVTLNMLQKGMAGSRNRRFLIDGYPRAVDQAKAFEQQVGRPRLVIFLDCPLDTMQQRLMKRGETSQRSDDNAETIKKRFNTFQSESLPVVAYYQSLASDLVMTVSAFPGSSVPPPDKVYKSINSMLSALRPTFAKTVPKSDLSMTVCILGGPGCGKGTNCERLVEDFGFEHLSTGDMLRKEVKSGSVIGKTVSKIMEGGQLVPIEITMEMLKWAMVGAENKFFLVDGFPRAVDQAKQFDSKLGRPHLIIYLVCSTEVMKERLLERGKSSGRADDNLDIIRSRLETFLAESKPVVDYYKRKAPQIVKEVSAERNVNEVYEEVKAIVAEELAHGKVKH